MESLRIDTGNLNFSGPNNKLFVDFLDRLHRAYECDKNVTGVIGEVMDWCGGDQNIMVEIYGMQRVDVFFRIHLEDDHILLNPEISWAPSARSSGRTMAQWDTIFKFIETTHTAVCAKINYHAVATVLQMTKEFVNGRS